MHTRNAASAVEMVLIARRVAESVDTCFGVGCPLRRTCLRYLAIDFAPGVSTTKGTCCLDWTYPDYLHAEPVSERGGASSDGMHPALAREEPVTVCASCASESATRPPDAGSRTSTSHLCSEET